MCAIDTETCLSVALQVELQRKLLEEYEKREQKRKVSKHTPASSSLLYNAWQSACKQALLVLTQHEFRLVMQLLHRFGVASRRACSK